MTILENTQTLATLIQEDKRREALDLLEKQPVDVQTILNKNADTLLSLACSQHNFPLADMLLEKGATITASLSHLVQKDNLVARYMALRCISTHNITKHSEIISLQKQKCR